jgi:DNA-directed RNA polymerase I subunit RPA1
LTLRAQQACVLLSHRLASSRAAWAQSREAVAKTLLGAGLAPAAATPGKAAASAGLAAAAAATYGGGKVVYRTMTDGDFMLTNRQPTLHKPGMMGHRARIMRGASALRAARLLPPCRPPRCAALLPPSHPAFPPPPRAPPAAERTIRFHYANCATFNADFDGDEINLHLPQDHLGRAEGYDIVHADEQFFVPTDGKPLRGLIQDHIVAGTLLTMKDCFLTQAQFCQLVYECVAPDCSGAWDVWLPPPAVLRPARLWTGKQVFTAALMHYTRDQLPFSMSAASKVPVDAWGGPASGEGRMHVWRNHLVAGCVDKATFGKHGFLHIFHVTTVSIFRLRFHLSCNLAVPTPSVGGELSYLLG